MSLVQAVITDNFILVGADTRGVNSDNTTTEGINKLIKMNQDIIFGCTGGIVDNFELFSGFCYYSPERGLVKAEENFDITYSDFVKKIIQRFNKMKIKHDDSSNNKKYNIMSVICGYNGSEFEITAISLTPEDCNVDGITFVHKKTDFPYKCVSMGKVEHKDEFERLTNKFHYEGIYYFTTILQYKNIIKEVFNNGAKIDTEINNKVMFETIKLKDVKNE